MKKILFIALTILPFAGVLAQEPADALRYSWYVPGGSARAQAIGGAMGSLGGDITSTFVNPAGLAFYKTGDLVLSPAYSFAKNKATYLTREEQMKYNRFGWGTTGFVTGTAGTGNTRNISFSLAYNRTADFNSRILYRGVNKQSSYSQKFLEEIGNANIRDANKVASDFPFGTSLAFNTYWIDTVAGGSSNNYRFQSRAANLLSGGLIQQNTLVSKGGINEFALGMAVNLEDKLYLGATFALPVLNYERSGEFIEADATANTNNFNYAQIKDNLSTRGIGANIKAGLIYKPKAYWRLGLAIHSPTFYKLIDKYSATITTDTEGYKGVQTQTSADVSGAASEFRYALVTPYKVIGSISYVLREIEDITKQKGFLTADVEYINYRASSFLPDNNANPDQATKNYLTNLNTAIDKAYKGAFNFRAGGELKFTTIMVRLGAAYYGNPYKDIRGEKGSRLNLSGGLGYRNEGFFIDLTYVHALNKDVNYAYRLQNSPYSGATIKNTTGNVLATLGFKF